MVEVERNDSGMSSQRIAGVSGGRTSALMALEYLPKDTVLCFQNTGREHQKTLDFLARLEDDLQRPIVRLEWRAPAQGEPPSKATFEVVSHAQLARRGEPFFGAAARVAQAWGFYAVMTYTLASEPGTSLRAAGWWPEPVKDSGSWNRPGRGRDEVKGDDLGPKIRWVRFLREWDDAFDGVAQADLLEVA